MTKEIKTAGELDKALSRYSAIAVFTVISRARFFAKWYSLKNSAHSVKRMPYDVSSSWRNWAYSFTASATDMLSLNSFKIFSAATYSFRLCSGRLAERMSVEIFCGECVRAKSSAPCSVLNTLYGRFALEPLHGRNTLYLYSGRFAFLYFLTVSAVFTESPLGFDSEKLLQNCYTKKRVSLRNAF